jgi:predicted HicB family RNase H-like nuclease
MRDSSKNLHKEFQQNHESDEADLSDGKKSDKQESYKEADMKPRVRIKPSVLLS